MMKKKTNTKKFRPLFLGVHLNEAEKNALLFLAEKEGLANASYMRRALLRDFQHSKAALPAKLLKALKLT